MYRIKKTIYHYSHLLKKKLKIVIKIVGWILITVGERMLGIHLARRYRFISITIERLLRSHHVKIVVKNYEEHPLFVRFITDIYTKFDENVSPEYFIRELALQLGADVSDISIGTTEKYSYIDITNTAIESLEKGTTRRWPQMYEKLRVKSVIN